MSKNRELADLAGKDLATQAELDAAVASSTEINDGTVSVTDTWSSQKIDADKQDTLVSGINIKSVNGTSILGSGDVTISTGLTSFNNVDTILTSQTYTVPATGKYRITAIGAGGSGGCAMNSSNSEATGGGAGGTSIHEVDLTQGQTLTVTIGAGGAQAFQNQNGKNGGNTTVTNGVFTITANGGSGGKYKIDTYGNLLGGTGGTATGGNVANITGGMGGSITTAYPHYGIATGGGGASLKNTALTRGGNITLSTSQSSYMYATGGGGCFFRGGDITSNVFSGSYATGGAGTSSNGGDCSGNPTATDGGKAANSISSSIVGIGGNGSINSTPTLATLSIGAATGGWVGSSSATPNGLSNNTLPLAGSGGASQGYSYSTLTDTYNIFFLGGGSGGAASSSGLYYAATTRGGNGVVFIEYKG